jgi:hypothetical protein
VLLVGRNGAKCSTPLVCNTRCMVTRRVLQPNEPCAVATDLHLRQYPRVHGHFRMSRDDAASPITTASAELLCPPQEGLPRPCPSLLVTMYSYPSSGVVLACHSLLPPHPCRQVSSAAWYRGAAQYTRSLEGPARRRLAEASRSEVLGPRAVGPARIAAPTLALPGGHRMMPPLLSRHGSARGACGCLCDQCPFCPARGRFSTAARAGGALGSTPLKQPATLSVARRCRRRQRFYSRHGRPRAARRPRRNTVAVGTCCGN